MPSTLFKFIVEYQPIDKTLCLGIVGSCTLLGNWQEPLSFTSKGFGRWIKRFSYETLPDKFEFKFVIFDKKTRKIVVWEDNENRLFDKKEFVDQKEFRANFRGIYDWRSAGVAVPVFSLRRNNGWGVGEFTDIILLADWCLKTNQKIIQILPVNDTTSTFSTSDSYPYSAISIYALHPIYLNLDRVIDEYKFKLPSLLECKRRYLDELDSLNYDEVMALKFDVVRRIFKKIHRDKKNIRLLDSFIKKNNWVLYYSAFCFLRDMYGTADFTFWGEFAKFDKKKIDTLIKDKYNEIDFSIYIFIQYHLFEQFKEVKRYLKKHNIMLKGDLPIGVGRHSVEVWIEPEMFNLTKQAGAPPDYFSRKGQVWGFPTYNWNNIAKKNFKWWRSRFRAMENLYDAFRIDHILGFFRIWELPENTKSGLLGYFNPALPLSVEEIEKIGIFVNDKNTLTVDQSDLQEDVLFIEDSYQKFHYHPRILAEETEQFKKLNPAQKRHFSDLYYDYFYERHNTFWQNSALKKLSFLLKETNMLVCGEDLGMIPKSVSYVLNKLNILSLEILRMPKEQGRMFVDIDNVPYRCVLSIGTHDTSTLRMWWQEDYAKTQVFYNQTLRLDGEAPKKCTPEIVKILLSLMFESNAMLVILPLQDYFALDNRLERVDFMNERINVPEDSNNNWNYRMHISLEELNILDDYNCLLKRIIGDNRK